MTMSRSPACRNKDPTPLLREMIENAIKTHTNVESVSENKIDRETDDKLYYSKKIMNIMHEVVNRLNHLEEYKKVEKKNSTDDKPRQTQKMRDLNNKLIAKNE
ncbi:hypothetical protein O181_094426 [Austropuccinia psidii MF-1]|uniref:Uncharacterized protein n=1 Tax=Austropuccinia psidii MF-1 TaxID=1389203 RepID=A0A9Q3J377_9BASI|nr:hypothetical protein [Austropuccinia psidii MF-1]